MPCAYMPKHVLTFMLSFDRNPLVKCHQCQMKTVMAVDANPMIVTDELFVKEAKWVLRILATPAS